MRLLDMWMPSARQHLAHNNVHMQLSYCCRGARMSRHQLLTFVLCLPAGLQCAAV